MRASPVETTPAKASRIARLRLELVLSIAAACAAIAAFALEATWGWRVLGACLLAATAWAFWLAFLFPARAPAYLRQSNAVPLALLGMAVGFAILVNAHALAQWTWRTCGSAQLQFCAGDPVCVNGEVVSVPSPARNYRALRYVRSCAATKAVSTHVSIVQTGDPLPEEAGNTFIVDGKVDLLMLWIDGRHLAISGAGGAARRLEKAQVNGVRVSYEAAPR